MVRSRIKSTLATFALAAGLFTMAACGSASGTGEADTSNGADTYAPETTPKISCVHRTNCGFPLTAPEEGGLDYNCLDDSDCNTDLYCVDALCAPGDTPGEDTVGEADGAFSYETEDAAGEAVYTDSTDEGVNYETETGVEKPVVYACNPDSMVDGECPDLEVPNGSYACIRLGEDPTNGYCGDEGVEYDLFPAGNSLPGGYEFCRERADIGGAVCNGNGVFKEYTPSDGSDKIDVYFFLLGPDGITNKDSLTLVRTPE